MSHCFLCQSISVLNSLGVTRAAVPPSDSCGNNEGGGAALLCMPKTWMWNASWLNHVSWQMSPLEKQKSVSTTSSRRQNRWRQALHWDQIFLFLFVFCILESPLGAEVILSKQDYNTVLKPRNHWQEDRSRFFIMQRDNAWQIKYTPFIAGFLICQSSKRAGETNFVNYSIKRPSEPAFTTQKPGSNPAQRNAVILMSLVSPLPAVTNREHIPLTVLPYYLLCQKWFNVSQQLVLKVKNVQLHRVIFCCILPKYHLQQLYV